MLFRSTTHPPTHPPTTHHSPTDHLSDSITLKSGHGGRVKIVLMVVFVCFIISLVFIIKTRHTDRKNNGLNLNRSQQKGNSTAYNTRFQSQVVCKGSVFPKPQNSLRASQTALAPSGGVSGYDLRPKRAYSYSSTPGEGKHRRF